MNQDINRVLDGDYPWALVRGDALGVLRELPDESVDAVVADPPYCSGGRTTAQRQAKPSKKYQQTGSQFVLPEFARDNMDQRSWSNWCALWLAECLRVAKPGAPICMFSDWRQLPAATDAVQHGGWLWRGIVPWDKTHYVRPQKGRFAAQAEYIVWGSKGAMPRDRGVGVLWGVVTGRVNHREKRHIAGKPVEVMKQVVEICEPGGVVLDPFSGSASTGVACVEKGYRYIGIELLDVFDEIGRGRLAGVLQKSYGIEDTGKERLRGKS